jgi:hypothetical protein
MRKFDWIDFDYSWNAEWNEKILFREFHNSTSSAISSYLRNRPFSFKKIFVWMRNDDKLIITSTDFVFHIEAPFCFDKYREASEIGKLELFSVWLSMTIFESSSLLFSDRDEVQSFLNDLKMSNYTYVRSEVIKFIGINGINKCVVRYIHDPYKVICRLESACGKINLSFPEGVFRRDEMDYGKAIRSCSCLDGKLVVESSKGKFYFSLDTSTFLYRV